MGVMISDYPMNEQSPTRRLILAGKGKPGSVRGELVRLADVADRKRRAGAEPHDTTPTTSEESNASQGPTGFHSDASGSPDESLDWDHYGRVMAERRKREAEGL